MSVLAGFARGMARGLAERSRQQMQFRQQVDLIGLQFAKEQKKEREKRERNRDAMVALGKQNGLTEASINNLVAAKNGGQTAEQIEKLVLRLQKQEKIDAARFEQQQKEHRAPIIERIANTKQKTFQSPSGTAEYPSMVGEGEAVLQKTALARSQEEGQRDKDALSAADQSSLLPSTIALYEKQNKIGTTGAELTREDELAERRNRSSFVGPFDPDKLKGKYDESSRRIGFAGTAMSDDTIAAIEARNKDDYSQMLGSNSNLLLEVSKNNDSIKIVNSPFYNKNSDSLLSKISVNAVKTNDPKFNSSLNFVQNNLSLGDITQEDQLNILGKVLRPYNYKERLDSPDFAAGDEARKRAELEKSISIASSEDISDSKGKLEFVSEEEELARNKRISERMKTEVPEAGERAANQTMAMLSESQAPFREDFITDSELEELGFSNYEEYKDSFELELKTAAKQELLNNTGLKTQFVQEKIDEKYQQYFERQKMSAPLARAKTLLAITAGDSYGDAYDGTDESLNSLMKLMPKATVEAVKQAFSNSEFGLKPEAELTKSGALATDTRPLYVENTKTTEEILEDAAVVAEVDENSPEEFMGTSTYDLELARAQRKDLAKRQAETGVMDAAGIAKKQFTLAAFDKNKPTTVNDLTVLAKEKPESIAASLVENLSLPFADAGFTVLDPVVKTFAVSDISELAKLDSPALNKLRAGLKQQIAAADQLGISKDDPAYQKLVNDFSIANTMVQAGKQFTNEQGLYPVLTSPSSLTPRQAEVQLELRNSLLSEVELGNSSVDESTVKRLKHEVGVLENVVGINKRLDANSTNVIPNFRKLDSITDKILFVENLKTNKDVDPSVITVLEENINFSISSSSKVSDTFLSTINGYDKPENIPQLETHIGFLEDQKSSLSKGSPYLKIYDNVLGVAKTKLQGLRKKAPFEKTSLEEAGQQLITKRVIREGHTKNLKELEIQRTKLMSAVEEAGSVTGEMEAAQIGLLENQRRYHTSEINRLNTEIDRESRIYNERVLERQKLKNAEEGGNAAQLKMARTQEARDGKIVGLKIQIEEIKEIPENKRTLLQKQNLKKYQRELAAEQKASEVYTENSLKALQEQQGYVKEMFNFEGERVLVKTNTDTTNFFAMPKEFQKFVSQAQGQDSTDNRDMKDADTNFERLKSRGESLIQILDDEPDVITLAGTLASKSSSVLIDLASIFDIEEDMTEDFNESLMTEEMVQRYAAEERNKVFDLIGDKELAKKVADYRSNLILYTYRLGASEGQAGMAMSNRDFAILMESQSGKSAPTVAARIKRELTEKSRQLDSDIRKYNANSRVSKYIRNSGIDPTIKSKVASRYEYKRNSGLLNFAKATQDANNLATNKLLDQIIKKSGIDPESKNFIFEMIKEASTQIKSKISSEEDKQEYMDRIIEEKLAKEFGMSREDSLRLFKSFNTLTNN